MEKYKKSYTKTIDLKYQLRHGMIKFELPHESYFVSDIQDQFQYIIKKHETLTDNLPIRIYVIKQKIEQHLKSIQGKQ